MDEKDKINFEDQILNEINEIERKKLEKDIIDDFDNYGIREDWETIKSIVNGMDDDIDRLLKNKSKRASTRVRNKLSIIKKKALYIRKSILMQVQDNKTDSY